MCDFDDLARMQAKQFVLKQTYNICKTKQKATNFVRQSMIYKNALISIKISTFPSSVLQIAQIWSVKQAALQNSSNILKT